MTQPSEWRRVPFPCVCQSGQDPCTSYVKPMYDRNDDGEQETMTAMTNSLGNANLAYVHCPAHIGEQISVTLAPPTESWR